jgi:hypothetical protein
MATSPVLDLLTGIIGDLRDRAGLTLRPDSADPLLHTAVMNARDVATVGQVVQERMGPAYKPAGESAVWKNWFDGFVKAVGGVRSEQTLFRLDVDPEVSLYCAFWPWASDAQRVSIRLGVHARDPVVRDRLICAVSAR